MKEKLTKREKEVCRTILELAGNMNLSLMTERLKIQPRTVRTHLTNIYSKRLIATKSELVYQLLTDKTLLEE